MDYSRLIEVRFCSLWYWRICYLEFTLNTGASGVNSESSDEESSEAGQMPLAQHEVLCCTLRHLHVMEPTFIRKDDYNYTV